jgi:hypothetical protein
MVLKNADPTRQKIIGLTPRLPLCAGSHSDVGLYKIEMCSMRVSRRICPCIVSAGIVLMPLFYVCAAFVELL